MEKRKFVQAGKARRANTEGLGEGCALDSRDKPGPTECEGCTVFVGGTREAPGTDFERPKEPPP